MNKLQQKADTLVKKVTNYLLVKEIDKWPPDCSGFFSQPVRPYIDCNSDTEKVHTPTRNNS